MNVQKPKVFQLQGGFAPLSPDQGLCPWTSLGLRPQTLIIEGSHLYLGGGLQLSSPALAASAVDATLYHQLFPVAAARAWNSLPPATRAANSLLQFRRETKAHLFRYSCFWTNSSTVADSLALIRLVLTTYLYK